MLVGEKKNFVGLATCCWGLRYNYVTCCQSYKTFFHRHLRCNKKARTFVHYNIFWVCLMFASRVRSLPLKIHKIHLSGRLLPCSQTLGQLVKLLRDKHTSFCCSGFSKIAKKVLWHWHQICYYSRKKSVLKRPHQPQEHWK